MNKFNITSAQYFADDQDENSSIIAIINGARKSVPLDPANRHYAAILELAEKDGNEIQAAE